jgi:Ribbon-helix-helix protein, copG family
MRKLRKATVHLDEHTFDEVERLALAERRPVANLLRCLVEDAVAGRSSDAAHEVAA